MTKLGLLGLILILAVMAFGFLPVEDATWRAWRLYWSAGAGAFIGLGVFLIFIDLVRGDSMD